MNQRNERAQTGLETIDMDRRHIALLKHAEELLERNDYAGAESDASVGIAGKSDATRRPPADKADYRTGVAGREHGAAYIENGV